MELNAAALLNVPALTGVYFMKDRDGRVIYVGKAKNLRARLRAYVTGKDTRTMIPFLLAKVSEFEFVVTDTEKEALILENTLIKKHRPRYNIVFRDDKTYQSIRIHPQDDFPRFQLVRTIRNDGARYFGPYASTSSMRETLSFLQQVFPLRTCRDKEFKTRKRPCLEYDIKRCLAPCRGLVTREEYREMVREAVLFLDGRAKKLLVDLHSQMTSLAEAMHFEEAAKIRDRIRSIEATLEKQKVVSDSFQNQDVFGCFRESDRIQALILFVREGNVIGRKTFPVYRTEMETSEVLSALMKQYYDTEAHIPEEIIVPEHIEDEEVIAEWLREKRGRKVSVFCPRKGRKVKLVRIAERNAESVFRTAESSTPDPVTILQELVDSLKLRQFPHRIECFDISTTAGTYSVGSMVTFIDGLAEKSAYRRFKIQTRTGLDDYGMMYEVLKRRFHDKPNLPGLLIVDGGKGQLRVAQAVLEELDIHEVDVIGLAKKNATERPLTLSEHTSPAVSKETDRIYLPYRKNPVYFSNHSQVLFLLQRIRDEAHRFAVSYHRKLKEKGDILSVLDMIEGVGPQRKKILLQHFKTMAMIKKASLKELESIPGLGKETARRIHQAVSR